MLLKFSNIQIMRIGVHFLKNIDYMGKDCQLLIIALVLHMFCVLKCNIYGNHSKLG
jgi:uncharacterized membrane protein